MDNLNNDKNLFETSYKLNFSQLEYDLRSIPNILLQIKNLKFNNNSDSIGKNSICNSFVNAWIISLERIKYYVENPELVMDNYKVSINIFNRCLKDYSKIANIDNDLLNKINEIITLIESKLGIKNQIMITSEKVCDIIYI